MSQFEKLLQRIRNNPKTVKFDELESILLENGYTCRTPGGGQSLYLYKARKISHYDSKEKTLCQGNLCENCPASNGGRKIRRV